MQFFWLLFYFAAIKIVKKAKEKKIRWFGLYDIQSYRKCTCYDRFYLKLRIYIRIGVFKKDRALLL